MRHHHTGPLTGCLPGPGDPPQPGHTLARFAGGRGPRRRWRLWNGELWRRYAREAYASLAAEDGVTVETEG
jgi:hypothetical protein